MNSSDLVIYVWEGQADIAERVERCMLNMDVEVIRADGLNLPPASAATSNSIAVVSVSVLEGARFTRQNIEGTFGGMPVLWVSSNLRGASAGSYATEYSHVLPFDFTGAELRAMLMNVQTEIDERVLAARADWAQVQAIWQRAGGHVPTQERARAWQHAVLFFRWLFAPALDPAWPRGRRARG